MEPSTCPYKNFCGQKGADRACHGVHPRTVQCQRCGKEFKSSCGAGVFCSAECQAQSKLGRKIIGLIGAGRFGKPKSAKRRAQLAEARDTWLKTPNGIRAKKGQNARYYQNGLEKKVRATREEMPRSNLIEVDGSTLILRRDPPDMVPSSPDVVLAFPETCEVFTATSSDVRTIEDVGIVSGEFESAGADFDPTVILAGIPDGEIASECDLFVGKNSLPVCRRPDCGNLFEFDARVPDKKYCCGECYDSMYLLRKRLKHWHERTGCLYAREIYKLLVGEQFDSR